MPIEGNFRGYIVNCNCVFMWKPYKEQQEHTPLSWLSPSRLHFTAMFPDGLKLSSLCFLQQLPPGPEPEVAEGPGESLSDTKLDYNNLTPDTIMVIKPDIKDTWSRVHARGIFILGILSS